MGIVMAANVAIHAGLTWVEWFPGQSVQPVG